MQCAFSERFIIVISILLASVAKTKSNDVQQRLLTSQFTCGVSFLYSSCSYQCSYSSTPSARVRYPFGKWKGEKGKETFGKQPSVNIRVVTEWYAKVPPANFCHRRPTDILQMSHRSPMVFPKPASRFPYTKGILRVYKRKVQSNMLLSFAKYFSQNWHISCIYQKKTLPLHSI